AGRSSRRLPRHSKHCPVGKSCEYPNRRASTLSHQRGNLRNGRDGHIMTKALLETEQSRRRQLAVTMRAAIAQGQSLENYLAAHEQAISAMTAMIREKMAERRATDPVEVLPEILTNLQESAVAEARVAAKTVAREEFRAMLRKATA